MSYSSARKIDDLDLDDGVKQIMLDTLTRKWVYRMFHSLESVNLWVVDLDTDTVAFSVGAGEDDNYFAGGQLGVTWGSNPAYFQAKEKLLAPDRDRDWFVQLAVGREDNPYSAGKPYCNFYRLHYSITGRPQYVMALSVELSSVDNTSVATLVTYFKETGALDSMTLPDDNWSICTATEERRNACPASLTSLGRKKSG